MILYGAHLGQPLASDTVNGDMVSRARIAHGIGTIRARMARVPLLGGPKKGKSAQKFTCISGGVVESVLSEILSHGVQGLDKERNDDQ